MLINPGTRIPSLGWESHGSLKTQFSVHGIMIKGGELVVKIRLSFVPALGIVRGGRGDGVGRSIQFPREI